MSVGHTVRDARKRKRWSQRELAALLGVSKEFIGAIETGRKSVPGPRREALASLLDVPVDDLVPDTTRNDPRASERAWLFEQAIEAALARGDTDRAAHLKGRLASGDQLSPLLGRQSTDPRTGDLPRRDRRFRTREQDEPRTP
jgi:transcriptional regulator with XRE-family HTH domain